LLFVINPYTYPNNDPINFIDPWGLCGGKKDSWWKKTWDWWYDFSMTDPSMLGLWGFEVGFAESVLGLPKAIWTTITHPILTIRSIPESLKQTWYEFSSFDPYVSGRAIGRITADVVFAVISAKLAGKVSRTHIAWEKHGLYPLKGLGRAGAIKSWHINIGRIHITAPSSTTTYLRGAWWKIIWRSAPKK